MNNNKPESLTSLLLKILFAGIFFSSTASQAAMITSTTSKGFGLLNIASVETISGGSTATIGQTYSSESYKTEKVKFELPVDPFKYQVSSVEFSISVSHSIRGGLTVTDPSSTCFFCEDDVTGSATYDSWFAVDLGYEYDAYKVGPRTIPAGYWAYCNLIDECINNSYTNNPDGPSAEASCLSSTGFCQSPDATDTVALDVTFSMTPEQYRDFYNRSYRTTNTRGPYIRIINDIKVSTMIDRWQGPFCSNTGCRPDHEDVASAPLVSLILGLMGLAITYDDGVADPVEEEEEEESQQPLPADPVSTVPEPATLILFMLGLAGLGIHQRKRLA